MGPDDFFTRAISAFARAASTSAVYDAFLRIAGRSFRLEVLGDRLFSIIEPPFRHLRSKATAKPDFHLAIADHRETGIAIPPAPLVQAGEAIVRYRGEQRAALSEAGGAQVWMLDYRRGSGFLWIREAAELASWDRIHPLRQILGAWAEHLGLTMVHAGAVGFGGKGVLLVGRGGSGKSTTVLACLEAGASSAGDDYVLIEAGAAPVAHSLYANMRLFESQARRFPFLLPAVDSVAPGNDGTPKLTTNIAIHRPERMTAALPLTAVVVPRVAAGGATRLYRENGGTALFAMAPNTLQQIDRQSRIAFERMARLCKALPCWRLELGAEIDAVPGEIRRAIAAGASAALA